MEERGRGHAHAQGGLFTAGGLARPMGHRLGLLEQLPAFGQEYAARVGQLHFASGARQQFHAEFFLQGLDLLRQRWLGHVKPLGSAHEAQFFCDGDEIFQLPQVHRLSPVVCLVALAPLDLIAPTVGLH